jgi:hypothetical protein
VKIRGKRIQPQIYTDGVKNKKAQRCFQFFKKYPGRSACPVKFTTVRSVAYLTGVAKNDSHRSAAKKCRYEK